MTNNDFLNAKAKGIIAPQSKGFMAFDDVNGHVNVNYEQTARMLAQDAQITSNNVGYPSAYATYLDPRIVEILFSVNNATAIFNEEKQGSWTDDFATFPVEEGVGSVSNYSDYGNAVSSDLNYEFPVRENVRFQTVIKYGDLENAKAESAKIALASRKQVWASEVIARASNNFYLFGVAGKKTYGLLNDPNLNPTISPISIGGKSTWAEKLADNSATFANIAYNDITKLVNELSANNGGNIDPNTPMKLAISNTMMSYLLIPNSYGITAKQMLNNNYPNLEIVQLPQLSTEQGEQLYLTAPELMGVQTASNVYADKLVLGRLIPDLSSYKQKATSTTFGCIVRRPSLIARMSGL